MINNNHVFIVGDYEGNMNYQNASSLPLISTGINGFLLRASTLVAGSSPSGSFRSTSVNEDTDEVPDKGLPILEDFELSIYPNPNNGRFIIELEASNEPTRVSIYSVRGQKVWETQMSSTSNSVNLEGVSPGLYLVYLVRGSKQDVKKILIE